MEEGRQTEKHILETIVQIVRVEGGQQAVEVDLGILRHIILVLHHKSAVDRIRHGLVLLGGENSIDPVVSRLVILKTHSIILVEVLRSVNKKTVG